ncbi:MAG TPA: toll/interleukin-1 receptor domain-containing protein [Pseudonocardiaceae bacterium]
MSGVFVNYRGDDSGTAAALIDREFAARFGGDRVFLDCRSVPVGADFADAILTRLRSCTVLLVVMGPRWLTLTGDTGARRIDDPADWVRCEIAEALSHRLRVIPVLLDGAVLPTAGELPSTSPRSAGGSTPCCGIGTSTST